jgi:MYXO-CTERM domain-containing protein
MKTLVLRAVPLAVAFTTFFTTGLARADYCRTKACDNQAAYDDVWQTMPDPTCERDSVGCLIAGTPLYWPQSCISFSVQHDGSKKQDIAYDQVHDVVVNAFQTWLNADCGGGTTPSFAIADYGPATCSKAEYNKDQGNTNVFTFRDQSWPYANAEDTLALTTITYNTENAQIYDADVEINSAEATFTFSDQPSGTVDDLLSVLTHECGHFLGLSHDPVYGSTMYPEYTPGDLYQRTLDTDDVNGICNIFPPGQTVDTVNCAPRHGFSDQCGVPQSTGCGVTPAAPTGPLPSGAALLAGLGLAGMRRARRRRRAT